MQEQELYINGTRIYSLTNHDLHSFCLSLYIRAGSIFEDITENGISHLFEHTVFRNLKNKYEKSFNIPVLSLNDNINILKEIILDYFS